MKELDEIIYDALTADQTVATETNGRIISTCVEVPPTEDDNTPLPYIIIAEEPGQNETGTKDSMWEGADDVVNVGVIISAVSPSETKRLRKLVRAAVERHVATLQEKPYLQSLSWDGIAWDWMKPCYYDTLHYQCDTYANIREYEQED